MEDPLRIIARHHGVFLRREALEAGYTDKMLASLRRQGVVRRVVQGAYCFVDVWETSSPEERHLVQARAVLRTTTGRVALSHVTALVAQGVAVWGADLSRVHLTRLDDVSGRVDQHAVHHEGRCPEEDVEVVAGLPVTVLDRAVIESATIMTMESSVVSADSALHQGGCDEHSLYRRFKAMNRWWGSRKIHVLLALMDGRAESPGESRARVLFKREGLPRPELQFAVYDESGTLVATTDFVWHERKAFGEFDGKVKYMPALLREGETPSDAVFREKRREDRVRGITGYGCGRMVWADLGTPQRTAAYFRRILRLD